MNLKAALNLLILLFAFIIIDQAVYTQENSSANTQFPDEYSGLDSDINVKNSKAVAYIS